MLAQQVSPSPHHAAELLRRELEQLEAGDIAGARDVLEELLAALLDAA